MKKGEKATLFLLGLATKGELSQTELEVRTNVANMSYLYIEIRIFVETFFPVPHKTALIACTMYFAST